jgi:hypothetical protein
MIPLRIRPIVTLLVAAAASAVPALGQTSWATAASGNWNALANWSPAAVPISTTDTTITATGSAYTVTTNTAQSTGTLTLNSANATLLISGVMLSLITPTTAYSSFQAGTVQLNGGGQIFGNAPSGTTTLNNLAAIQSTGGTNYIYGNGTYGLIFSNSGTVTANAGTLYLGYFSHDTVTNSGTILATTGGTIFLGNNNDAWSTSGTLSVAGGGTINLGGTFSTANLGGTINATGGTLNITGSLNNASASLAAPIGGSYTLYGGTITGGTVASNALTFSNSGGTLSGVTMAGSFNLPTNASANFTVKNNATFAGGTTTFTAPGYDTVDANGTGTALTIASGATWTGAVNIYGNAGNPTTVANNGSISHSSGTNYIDGNSYGLSFTNGGTGVVTASGGVLVLGDSTNDTVTNTGTISATSGGTVDLGNYYYNYGTWSNTGTLSAVGGGTINLGGTFSTANLGGTSASILAVGGMINITGIMNNASATLNPPTSGIYTLAGGTITGGTIAGGAITTSSSGGTLNGVTMSGSFALPATYNYFTAIGGTTFTGNGTTTFSTSASNSAILNGTGTALTIAGGSTWTGGNLSIYSNNSSNPVTFVNQGAISTTAGSNAIYGNYSSGLIFQNSGSVTSSGGTLTLGENSGDSITNTGLISATSGGTIDLGYYYYNYGTWSNTGTLSAVGGGTINLGGTFSTANLGGTSATILAGGGTINITGALNNSSATLNPPTTGVYTLAGGTITGGTVAGGALTIGNTAGTLSGVTMSGNFTLPASNHATFYANTNTTFTGGTTAFASGGYYDSVYLNGTGTALTIAPSATWTGGMSIYDSSSNPVALLVQGVLNHSATNSTFYGSGYGLTINNSGTLESSGGGSLTLGYYTGDTITNQSGGIIEANAGTMDLDYYQSNTTNLSGNTLTGGPWVAANGGTMNFYGAANSIVTNAVGTTLVLDGSGSHIYSGTSLQSLEQTLTTNNGTLEVLTNRNFPAAAAFANNGSIQLGGGTFSAPSLANGIGSSLSGFGTFSPTGGVTIGSGVAVSPGSPAANQYVGELTFNSLTLGQGGQASFDLVNASGVAGTGYDTITVTGTANVTATSGNPFQINFQSINPGTGTPGLATFNMSQTYQWTLLAAASLTGFSTADFTLNTVPFANSLGGGTFSLSSNATSIFLNFTPVPEPSTWALLGSGVAVVAAASWRRRSARPVVTR